MKLSAVLRTLGGIFPWLIVEVIKVLLIDTGFEMCHVRFASPKPLPSNFKALHQQKQIARSQ
jgi:hypothetical protein